MFKSPDTIFAVLGSIIVLAIVSTAVAPKSQAGPITSDFFTGFANSIKAARGN